MRPHQWPEIPEAYAAALNPASATKLNDRSEERDDDFFAPVREKANYKGPVSYTLPIPGQEP